MKFKLDDKGAVVVQDDKPVYVADDGKEIVFDYPATLATIARLNAEAKGHREEKEAARREAQAVRRYRRSREGPQGPRDRQEPRRQEADRGRRGRQGQSRKPRPLTTNSSRASRRNIKPVIDERDKFKADLQQEILGGAFSRSKFIAEKLAVPADIVQARFGQSFSSRKETRSSASTPRANGFSAAAAPAKSPISTKLLKPWSRTIPIATAS